MTPELCSTCLQLRVASIVDQTPLGVAVRAQSSELIALLVAYGADVNLGICPLDLAPELKKLQHTCIEELFKTACAGWENDNSSKPTLAPLFKNWNQLQTSLTKFSPQMESLPQNVNRESFDAHLGGLLHKMISTAIEEYESSTPSYKKQKKIRLIWLFSQITTFCYTFINKSGTSRLFSALNALNKIIDAGLVHDLFPYNDLTFHSSRLLNRSHLFEADDHISLLYLKGLMVPHKSQFI
ncbi:unnamed protein product [Strongylus vulgaris]|uniref:Uncharacterized protein n=1 Tax=Strongylus vulgaris TaxID=40348 RepID=A0A3P7J0S1_STRVU|nr:unnamed protein product [Strongylus vulgaris]